MNYFLTFFSEHTLLTGWLIFAIVAYLYAWLDYAYYRYDLKNKAIQVYHAITEEE